MPKGSPSNRNGNSPDHDKIKRNREQVPASRKLLLAAIIGISFSLRAPITSIGSLAGLIHDDLGVSNGFVGFITTLPLIAFAVCSPFISKVSDRLGIGKTMLAGLIAIVAGGVLRSYTGIAGLLIGTALVGVGISVANVLIPSIVKLKYPDKIGLITGIYITSMAIFASIGAGVSYPLAMAGMGWKSASVVWAGIALFAIFAWLPQRKQGTHAQAAAAVHGKDGAGHPDAIWKSPLAWYITLFFGLQSLNFYSLTAWIPSILQSNGMTPETAGYMALWFQLIGIPASFLVPILAARVKNQRTIVAGACAAYFLGITMLILLHSTLEVVIALLFLSSGGAAAFSWSMVMLSLKTRDAQQAIALSGMAQSVGYSLAAVGPTLCGVLFDFTGTWSPVLGLFLGITFAMAATGILASKREKLFR
ncbi:MAG: MFS transporter [Eubacteriales bacterium]|nr:MFS transporter [Eubacteriales bacterium]